MSSDTPQEEKTEEATAKRRQEFRDKGDVAKSTDLSAGFMLVASTIAVWLIITSAARPMAQTFAGLWARLDDGEQYLSAGHLLMGTVLEPVIVGLIPAMAILTVMGIFATMVQTGPLLSWQALTPNLNKFNPLPGIKRIFFSKDTVVNLLKSLAKVVLLAGVATLAVWFVGPDSTKLVTQHPEDFAAYLVKVALYPLFACSIAAIIIGVGDFFWQRHRMNEKMKMTKEETKREHKQSEGDPLIKGRRRRKHREIFSLHRLIETVPQADVIVTNPTHYSVALRYRPEEGGAPIVVAKGLDFRALKIRELAKEHDIPIVENIPLARGLHEHVEVGDYIPESFFRAVAEVLAFVYKQKSNIS